MVFGALFKAHAITQLRNRSAVFWNFAFPIFLMALFGLVFGKGGVRRGRFFCLRTWGMGESSE